MGQPRDRSRPLRNILREFGIGRGARVGGVGWKYFDGRRIPADALDVPAYLAEALDGLCGGRRVRNATAILTHPRDGLRVTSEPEQIAAFEHAAAITSAGVLNLMRHLREGARENALEKYLDSRGLPLSCHRMVSFGEKARRGLSSASPGRAQLGDAYTTAFGVWGALTCRAGASAGSGGPAGRRPRFLFVLCRQLLPGGRGLV
jgi:Xaa-Pro aminopeptidase